MNGIFDGKGFESVTKTQGSCSKSGCNACNFKGIKFGSAQYGSVVYPFYNRYLPRNDSRRLRRPMRVPNCNDMYNIREETELPPTNRTYMDYIRDGNLSLIHI